MNRRSIDNRQKIRGRLLRRYVLLSFWLICGLPCGAAPVSDKFLDRPIKHFEADDNDSFFHLCEKILKRPCGIDSSQYGMGTREELDRPPLDLTSTSPRKVLDEIILRHPDYRWIIRDGVINLEPKKQDDQDPLLRKVKRISMHGVSSLLAALDVFDLAGLSISYQELGRRRYFGTIDLDLTDVTVREALNAIVKADGQLIWVFGRSSNSGSKAAGTLTFSSSRQSGLTFTSEWKKARRWQRDHGDRQRGKIDEHSQRLKQRDGVPRTAGGTPNK